MSIKGALKLGLAAGLVAGIVLGLYILLVMGPLIDRAEALEGEENPVPAALRRVAAFGVGLAIGVFSGTLFALVFPFANSVLPGRSVLAKALALGILAYVIFSLLPLLNVPANPPAVETNLSVEEREFWYVGTIFSGLGGAGVGLGLHLLLRPRAGSRSTRIGVSGLSLLVVAVLWALPFLLRPEIERIPGVVPSSLIDAFYFLTLLEWAIFWVVLSAVLALLWSRSDVVAGSESLRTVA